MIENLMFPEGSSRHTLKRRIGAFFLVAFAVTAMFGPLAHAHFEEDFDKAGQSHISGGSLDPGQSHGDHTHNDHTHDNEEFASGHTEHTHDHNVFDHSHEIPGVTMYSRGRSGVVQNDVYLAFAERHNGRASFNIDRPPRL